MGRSRGRDLITPANWKIYKTENQLGIFLPFSVPVKMVKRRLPPAELQPLTHSR